MEAGWEEACRGPDTLNQGNAERKQQQLAGAPMLKWLFRSLHQQHLTEAVLLGLLLKVIDVVGTANSQ